ncbi:MAG: hypothetical protein WBW78_09210 [Terrimicrobiaceae bacterium]
MKRTSGVRMARLLAAILAISPLLGASPSPTPSPSQGKAAPGVTITSAPDDHVSATREVEAPSNHSFLSPIGDFARDSILRPKAPFEMVPGKDPNGWSFSLEPYAWAMGLNGKVGVDGLPPIHVHVSDVKLLQHLDWGIFMRGEIRKGRWGILADGFYAELSGSGDLRGVLYESGSLEVRQGLASLALAYRIIDDRRWFLDFYAGARYNYLGVSIDANIDEGGIEEIGDDVTQRISSLVDARVQSAVDAEVQRLRTQLANEKAILQGTVQADENILRGDVQAAESALRADVLAGQSALQDDVRARIAGSLESGLQTRLRRELAGSHPLRESVRDVETLRITKGVRNELRALVNAVLNARLVETRAGVEAGLAEARAAVAARLGEDRARVEARLAEDRASADARAAQARANAQAGVAKAEKDLAKAIAQEIEDALPTSGSGNVWWFDPIIGFRGQINFTRWLFLAAQGDVGGFGAGSQIAWNVQATLGVNFTRNIFAELGYRYMYVDYDNDNLLYQMNSFGLFSGIGVRF